MKQDYIDQSLAELAESTTLQTEIVQHRLALEWGQMLFTHAVRLWDDIEGHETLAYEDKVVAQAKLLEEVSSSLRHLQKLIARARHTLQRHRRHLQR